MAKCDLLIEINDRDRLYRPGDRVTGQVVVRASAEVKCKGLEISTLWKTHGRGNTDQGKGDKVTVYEGRWDAGQEYRYEFDLEVADGPSTYHGHYLNIDHYVHARVDLPWAFDPKGDTAFRVVSHATDEKIKESQRVRQTGGCGGAVGGVIGVVVVAVSLVFFLFIPFFLVLALPIGAIVGVWWFFFRYLPAKAMGQVACELEGARFCPGEFVQGTLVFTPPKDLPIDGITWKVTATEECVSGSGTNRTTHRHVAHESSQQLAPKGSIPGGAESRFAFGEELPDGPLYSVDLSDNELNWVGELRVALSGWPDWKKKLEFTVVPPKVLTDSLPSAPVVQELVETEEESFRIDDDIPFADIEVARFVPPHVDFPAAPPEPEAVPAITFDETAKMLWATWDDRDQLMRVVDAVRDKPMAIRAIVQRRDFFGSSDEFAYPGGSPFRAQVDDPPLPLILYVSAEQVDVFKKLSGEPWQGRGTIVGFCKRRIRVLVRVE